MTDWEPEISLWMTEISSLLLFHTTRGYVILLRFKFSDIYISLIKYYFILIFQSSRRVLINSVNQLNLFETDLFKIMGAMKQLALQEKHKRIKHGGKEQTA